MTAITIVPGTPGAPTPWDDLQAMWADAPDAWDYRTGDAALSAVAGGPLRGTLLRLATRRVRPGTVRTVAGIRITGLPDGTQRVERRGHLPLIVEHVSIRIGWELRTECVWPDSDVYA